jgi:hypothetical protein
MWTHESSPEENIRLASSTARRLQAGGSWTHCRSLRQVCAGTPRCVPRKGLSYEAGHGKSEGVEILTSLVCIESLDVYPKMYIEFPFFEKIGKEGKSSS